MGPVWRLLVSPSGNFYHDNGEIFHQLLTGDASSCLVFFGQIMYVGFPVKIQSESSKLFKIVTFLAVFEVFSVLASSKCHIALFRARNFSPELY